jgi:hypothetical protein
MKNLSPEVLRECRRLLKRRFLGWRIPELELPPDGLIDEVILEIATLIEKPESQA